ncbi:pilin [Oceanospirillum sanctuarii]|uniref:pilin n=1 Tax=Oceanospirillum sanctuarii TaxID=1434821 RepID=UPI000A3D41A0|nr:prepilin-type N-terminal cleavage/methylation domain-containing protein [Oceanospirillum sanctuarii]
MKTINKAAAKAQQGFTLVELLIVVAIIGILAAVGTPLYQDYTKQAKLTELDSIVDGYKTAVSVCMQMNAAADCDAGSNNIPSAVTTGTYSNLDTLGVANGVITAKSVAGLASDGTKAVKRVYTPSAVNGGLKWTMAETEE